MRGNGLIVPAHAYLGCRVNPHACWFAFFFTVSHQDGFHPWTQLRDTACLLLVLTASIDATVAYCFPNTAGDCLCVVAPWLAMSQPFGLRTALGVPQQSPCVLVLTQGASDNWSNQPKEV
jgi:hypothetical protein